MVVIVSCDDELIWRICEVLTGERGLIREVFEGDDGPKQLRREIYCYQPKVVLMDVRFGGQHFRAIEAIPKLLLNCESQPEVVLLSPRPSKALRRVADDMGCYDVVDFSRRGFARDVGDLVAAARLERDVPLVHHRDARRASRQLH
jgi:hypothetical protein